jgi:hypothetical protein
MQRACPKENIHIDGSLEPCDPPACSTSASSVGRRMRVLRHVSLLHSVFTLSWSAGRLRPRGHSPNLTAESRPTAKEHGPLKLSRRWKGGGECQDRSKVCG